MLKNKLNTAILLCTFCSLSLAEPIALWSFEGSEGGRIADSVGSLDGLIKGELSFIAGAAGNSMVFNGKFDYITIGGSEKLNFDGDFSVVAWVNPYSLSGNQQMIISKNEYSEGWRQWGLMLDSNNRFRFYMWDKGWKVVGSQTVPQAGKWYHIAAVVSGGNAKVYINGKLEGEGEAPEAIKNTPAALTIGGVSDGGNLRQMFHGAIDEAALYNYSLKPEDIAKMAQLQTADHEIPNQPKPIELWHSRSIPKAAEIKVLEGVEFGVIKPYEFAKDGYRFLHGVALTWHKGKLYASFGHNRYAENLAGEEARGCYSEDGGKTWSDIFTIDSGDIDEPSGVSHGVFLSHNGTLWAFHGAYGKSIADNCRTKAYTLNEKTGQWISKGVVISDGFFPLQEPQKMLDGNWIMGGARIGGGNPAAVAISDGEDLTKWDLVVIPKATGKMWGESSVIVECNKITNIARYHRDSQTVALVAYSNDYGRTWTQSQPSNMNMAASKPYTGTLSTGQHYLICTTTADSGNARHPLTIALTRPGESAFSDVFVIRHAEFTEGAGESHPNSSLSYPYAIEKDAKLYVGYSNDGGGVGRVGEGRELWNNNSAELAIIPISALAVKEKEFFTLWTGGDVPSLDHIEQVKGVKLHNIDVEGYNWLKGAAIENHKGDWFLSFGLNIGAEQSSTEVAKMLISTDSGESWSRRNTLVDVVREAQRGDVINMHKVSDADLVAIDAPEGERAASHGVFLRHKDKLWAFMCSFYNKGRDGGRIHTRAFLFDDAAVKWQPKGVVAENGFWPMQEPQRLEDNTWIMAGTSIERGSPPAVAICDNDEFAAWRVIRIPTDIKVWGECAILAKGSRVMLISRGAWGGQVKAYVSLSDDYGNTWSQLQESNLPMALAKPYAGELSTGQRYLISSIHKTVGSHGSNKLDRRPLTIAVSKPGEDTFSKIYRIRDDAWAYPYAVEYEGHLWVATYIYSPGATAGVAIVPIDSLTSQ